jgi:hypothetical protein
LPSGRPIALGRGAGGFSLPLGFKPCLGIGFGDLVIGHVIIMARPETIPQAEPAGKYSGPFKLAHYRLLKFFLLASTDVVENQHDMECVAVVEAKAAIGLSVELRDFNHGRERDR